MAISKYEFEIQKEIVIKKRKELKNQQKILRRMEREEKLDNCPNCEGTGISIVSFLGKKRFRPCKTCKALGYIKKKKEKK